MNAIPTSWRTTTLGAISLLLLVIGAVKVALVGGVSAVDFGVLVPQVLTAAVGIFSRDNAASVAAHDAQAAATASALAHVGIAPVPPTV